MVDAIRTRKLSAREVMQAHLQQIQRVNAHVNAMVTMVPEEQLMAQAAAADEALAQGKWLGPLHGLPVAVKDLHETTGIRTTYGSPLHKNYVPDFDCRVVQREKEAGAIVLGKTNVPEFGLGSQTFNPVFGPTHNRMRYGSSGRRQRHGRLSAQSAQLLQCCRHPQLARARVERAYRLRLVHPFGSRPRRS
jgi:Asp-tRNA(Asn)/Glu-tRNA(Gln) amidotransferase A subunit family amidase